MAVKAKADKFSNLASIVCTESAANTITFKKLEVGLSTFEKVAWVVHRIEYFLNPDPARLNSTTDNTHMALAVSNTLASILSTDAFTNPAVLDLVSLTRYDLGAAASGIIFQQPIVKDFVNLPGGGLIIPPSPLYGVIQGGGEASAAQGVIRIFYTMLDLSTEDYWELVEARRLISS